MIVIPILVGVLCAVGVNGLADNLLRDEGVPLPAAAIPRCAYCDRPRKLADWSAVVSNLLLSGGCLRCGAPRPFRDLLVEAILWIGIPAVWLGNRSGWHDLLIGGLLLSAFLLFTVMDFERRSVVVEAVALVSLVFLLDAWIRGADLLSRALSGGLGGFLIFLVLYFLGRALAGLFKLGGGIEPLGFGDVILAALVGFIVGWPGVLLAVLCSIILGGLAGLGLLALLLVRGKAPRNATMAYGPYLLISGLLVYFYGGTFIDGIRSLLESI
jgi:prepilin signal peptidase PulO-like enzyme (type II secretory pathway)